MARTKQERENAKIRSLVNKLERAEVRMLRAQNAWQKARKALRTYELAFEKNMIGGKIDYRVLAENFNDGN